MISRYSCKEHAIREKYWKNAPDFLVAEILGMDVRPKPVDYSGEDDLSRESGSDVMAGVESL
ncbi:MAG TPA: hypothetical protein VEK33_02385 [Terriglobales bacterium]|nr:hypothetical protein [Terriglobales bacterium]